MKGISRQLDWAQILAQCTSNGLLLWFICWCQTLSSCIECTNSLSCI